mmetsp:Transcript_6172/g.15738  ORF Transcript_6172/g.15738 Transcript_6172/m.15738 type:complete len:227 (+) Transcript_6172:381-1061(+)
MPFQAEDVPDGRERRPQSPEPAEALASQVDVGHEAPLHREKGNERRPPLAELVPYQAHGTRKAARHVVGDVDRRTNDVAARARDGRVAGVARAAGAVRHSYTSKALLRVRERRRAVREAAHDLGERAVAAHHDHAVVGHLRRRRDQPAPLHGVALRFRDDDVGFDVRRIKNGRDVALENLLGPARAARRIDDDQHLVGRVGAQAFHKLRQVLGRRGAVADAQRPRP